MPQSSAAITALRLRKISRAARAAELGLEIVEEIITPPTAVDVSTEQGQADFAADAIKVKNANADAIFVSCTNLWTYDVLGALEAELGKPVLSANQVTAWATLVDAGVLSPGITQPYVVPAADQSLFARAA